MKTIQVIVLSGGNGNLLYPLTETTCKPLLPIANKPLIAYVLELLQRHHLVDITIVVNNKIKAKVQSYLDETFEGKPKVDSQIKLFSPKEDVSMVQSIAELYATGAITRDVLLLYGDLLSNCNLFELLERHFAYESDITVGFNESKNSSLAVFVDKKESQIVKISTSDTLNSVGAKFRVPLVQAHPELSVLTKYSLARIFVLKPRALRLLSELNTDLFNFSEDWLPFIVDHQLSSKLLSIYHQTSSTSSPLASEAHNSNLAQLQIKPFFFGPAFHQRVTNVQEYRQLNIDISKSLSKPEPPLPLTPNNTKCETGPLNPNAKVFSSLISEGVEIGDGAKITGCFIGAGTIIGKNSVVVESFIGEGSQVGENCKVEKSTIGSGVVMVAKCELVLSVIGDGYILQKSEQLNDETRARVADGDSG